MWSSHQAAVSARKAKAIFASLLSIAGKMLKKWRGVWKVFANLRSAVAKTGIYPRASHQLPQRHGVASNEATTGLGNTLVDGIEARNVWGFKNSVCPLRNKTWRSFIVSVS